MKKIVIAFKSRNTLQLFAKIMKAHSIPTEIINTPRSISISCGLSARTDFRFYNSIIILLQNAKLEGFLGLYLLERQGLREQTQRLY